jgi:hypothetical protein
MFQGPSRKSTRELIQRPFCIVTMAVVMLLSGSVLAGPADDAPNPLPPGLTAAEPAEGPHPSLPPLGEGAEETTPAAPVEPAEPVPVPPVAVEPAPTAPVMPAPSEPVAKAIPRTQWEPFDNEVVRVADGSLRVCSAVALPLTIVPGVGDIVGTIADWFCIIPAAVAIDYAGANHGRRESTFWQPALALVLKKGFETLVDMPIMVVTIGVIVTVAVGGVASAFLAGFPVTVVTAGAVGVTLVTYLGLKGVRDGIGNFLFDKAYAVLVEETGDEATADARRDGWIQPGLDGVPAGFGLMATVAGSRPPFEWAWAVPVVGPVWRSEKYAEHIKWRTRRYASEVMGVEKANLSGMDRTADTLSAVQGFSMAVGHVGLGVGVGLFGAGLTVSLTDQDNEGQTAAELLGGAGIVAVVGGAAAIVVSVGAEKLQMLLVPAAWAAAE